jgi:hypothetical protein
VSRCFRDFSSTSLAVVTLKGDGSIVTSGRADLGEDSSAVQANFNIDEAIAALWSDSSIVT